MRLSGLGRTPDGSGCGSEGVLTMELRGVGEPRLRDPPDAPLHLAFSPWSGTEKEGALYPGWVSAGD